MQYDLPAALNATWQTALEKLMAEQGEGATPLDALKAMAEMIIATDPEQKVPPGRRQRKEPVYVVVYHVGPDGKAWHEGENGREAIPLSAVLREDSAEVIEVPDLEGDDFENAEAIRFGERGSVPEDARDRPTPEWMRRAVLSREGHRCVICGSRRACRVHHVESRAHGGETRIERLVTVCLSHHSLIHDGFLFLSVDESGRVVGKDAQGRIHGSEVSAREVLSEAPEEASFAEIEAVEKPKEFDDVPPPSPVVPRGTGEASEVVVAPDSPDFH